MCIIVQVSLAEKRAANKKSLVGEPRVATSQFIRRFSHTASFYMVGGLQAWVNEDILEDGGAEGRPYGRVGGRREAAS